MKTIIISVFCMLSQIAMALNIQQVTLASVSAAAINVSLNTEAVELYYFHSSAYSISGNTISLKAYYVEGFGSAIAVLNNNFEIPVDNFNVGEFTISVQVYYANQEMSGAPDLQDEIKILFATPLATTIFLPKEIPAIQPRLTIYPNPTTGILIVPRESEIIKISSLDGRNGRTLIGIEGVLNLFDFPDGIYFVEVNIRRQTTVKKVILKR